METLEGLDTDHEIVNLSLIIKNHIKDEIKTKEAKSNLKNLKYIR